MLNEKLVVKNNNKTYTDTPNIAYYIDLGRKSYENYIIHSYESDLDIAISSYERALEIDPDNAESYYKLASLLWEKGQIDIDFAISHCQKAVHLSPDNMDARLFLGYFFRIAGYMEEAIQEFKEAADINFFTSAKPRIALGVSLIQNSIKTTQKFKDVLSGLGQFLLGMLLLLNDNKSLTLLARSVCEELQSFKYRLKGLFYELLRLNRSAVNVYEKAVDTASNKELFYRILGDLQKKSKNYLIAADYYRRAIGMNPDNPENYYRLINSLDDEIDAKEIISCYRQLCELEPDNSSLYNNLGHVYLEDKNHFGAIESFRKALSMDPENPFYHNSMAYALVQVDDYDGAINEYQQAISFNPDKIWTSIVCQALAAIYYQAKGNQDAAIMTYQMALNYDPNSVEALIAIAEIYYDKGNFDAAIASYKKALSFETENAQAYCNLGFVYWEKNEVREAINNYQRAIAIYPEYDIAYNNLGVAYLDGLTKPELGLAMFELAIKNNPNYALAYYNKGRSLEMLHKKADAANYYQMALDINTFTNELDPEEISKRLAKLFKV